MLLILCTLCLHRETVDENLDCRKDFTEAELGKVTKTQ